MTTPFRAIDGWIGVGHADPGPGPGPARVTDNGGWIVADGHCCRTCVYYVMTIAAAAPQATDVGRCHRYPPVWVTDADGATRDVEFPAVQHDQWCGEWQPAAVPVAVC